MQKKIQNRDTTDQSEKMLAKDCLNDAKFMIFFVLTLKSVQTDLTNAILLPCSKSSNEYKFSLLSQFPYSELNLPIIIAIQNSVHGNWWIFSKFEIYCKSSERR